MSSDVARSRQKMPTAAKLIGGIALAICAYGIAGIVDYRVDALGSAEINPVAFAFVGFCFGWANVGVMAQFGYLAAWSSGIAAAITGAFTMVVLGAAHHVYKGLFYHAYKDVDGMLIGFFRKAMEFFSHLTDPYVIAALVAAGLLSGIFAGFAARLWR